MRSRTSAPFVQPYFQWTSRTHTEALRLAERYGYAIFDALMIAAALRAGSDTLWSDDMQDGMVIDGRLRIANPFRGVRP